MGGQDRSQLYDRDDHPTNPLPDRPLRDDEVQPYNGHEPVLFGHYRCRKESAEPINPLATYLDYSVAHDGVAPLAAHHLYLEHLGGDMASPDEFPRGAATAGGELREGVVIERPHAFAELALVDGGDLRELTTESFGSPERLAGTARFPGAAARSTLLLIATATMVPIRLRLNESADTTSTGRRLPGPTRWASTGRPTRSRRARSPVLVDRERLECGQTGVELGRSLSVHVVEACGDLSGLVGIEQLRQRLGVQLGP